MRILALIRHVLDAEESIRITDLTVDRTGRKAVIDTMDEYGLEEALRQRDLGVEAEIVAVAVGPASAEETLRSALSMGADRAIHVETDLELDVIALSAVIAQIARAEQADLIFCGGQQSDWDSQALGPATAERLNWPQATWTRALELKGALLAGQHDAEDGLESFEVELPAVITTQQGLNQPRYPTLPNIMKAKRKEIRKDTMEQYSVRPNLYRKSLTVQSQERRSEIFDGKDAQASAAQLVNALRTRPG